MAPDLLRRPRRVHRVALRQFADRVGDTVLDLLGLLSGQPARDKAIRETRDLILELGEWSFMRLASGPMRTADDKRQFASGYPRCRTGRDFASYSQTAATASSLTNPLPVRSAVVANLNPK